ncbi:efflux RND transporter periplasmic adaptor subunit [Spirosoma sp. SC4-14]|uniref:efflux RND transporter periplasmic adaptor subunit n=1 Tax=Spirosoma sp. SC4-14 TaxID=3128900 RepID=UPI0030CEDF59
MKRSVFNLYTLLLFSTIGLSLTGCGSGSGSDEKSVNDAEVNVGDSAKNTGNGPITIGFTQAQYDVAEIQVGQPELRTLSTTLKVNGVLDVPPQSQVSVSMPFGGYVRSIKLEPGVKVSKGQTLAILENPEFVQIQQDYLNTKAQLEFAELEFARQQELSRENVNALKVVQKTRADRQSLEVQLAGLAQRLALLHINPATLRADRLTRTVVVPSPVTGYITDVPVNNGRYVNPSDVIIEVTDVNDLHVHLTVFEKDITRIHPGQAVKFGLGDNAAMPHRATIFLKGKSISSDRTIPVLARPLGWSDDFIPGAYVAAQIDVTTQPLTVLPDAAVVSFGGKSYIYVLDSKSGQPVTYQFRQIEVKTGISQKGYTAVTIPPSVDVSKTPVVVKGAYSLLSQLNNSGEEE